MIEKGKGGRKTILDVLRSVWVLVFTVILSAIALFGFDGLGDASDHSRYLSWMSYVQNQDLSVALSHRFEPLFIVSSWFFLQFFDASTVWHFFSLLGLCGALGGLDWILRQSKVDSLVRLFLIAAALSCFFVLDLYFNAITLRGQVF